MRKGEYAMAIKPDPHEMAFSLLNELTDDTLTLASLFLEFIVELFKMMAELEARVSKLLDEIEGVMEIAKERVASLERISKRDGEEMIK